MNIQTLNLCNGKYTFVWDGKKLSCLRYGEEWRDFAGDNAVLALFQHAADGRNSHPNEEIRTTAYACGYEHGPGKFGMFDGPSPDLWRMLEAEPEEESRNPCIVRFDPNGGEEVIYRWVKGKWMEAR